VLLLEVASGKILSTLKTEQEATLKGCYSRDGKMQPIGAGSADKTAYLGKIELWDVAKEKRSRH
jgi:hypothetical protein